MKTELEERQRQIHELYDIAEKHYTRALDDLVRLEKMKRQIDNELMQENE